MRYKSAILTIFDYCNYGNRLQNYALHTPLSRYGACASIVMPIGIKDSKDLAIEILKQKIRVVYGKLFDNDRALMFRRFSKGLSITNQRIPNGGFFITESNGFINLKNNSYDFLVIGSDQVWNYQWLTTRELELRLGSFASSEHPIISYAASFGISKIDDSVAPSFKKFLPMMKDISVREDKASEMVKGMTGLDATVVLDPTLMLDANEWLNITENFVSTNDKYVLTYFLGSPTEKQEEEIQRYAQSHGCRIRRVLDLRDKETYVAGVQDFVELFSKAQYVFTDSYHACCFSILFHKQFTVFNRAGMNGKSNMNSRMETLFRLFDLDSVMIDSGLAPEIDYEKVDHLLEENRKESQNWLDKAMEG